LAKRAGAYRSEKRKKELIRQKKQEEKRLKRLRKGQGGEAEETAEETGPEEVDRAEETTEGEGEKSQSSHSRRFFHFIIRRSHSTSGGIACQT
jgi:hypothetical protein